MSARFATSALKLLIPVTVRLNGVKLMDGTYTVTTNNMATFRYCPISLIVKFYMYYSTDSTSGV